MPDWLTIAGTATLAALALAATLALSLWSYYGRSREKAGRRIRAQVERRQRRRERREARQLSAATLVITPGVAADPQISVARTPVLGHLDGDVTTDVTAATERPGASTGDTARHRATASQEGPRPRLRAS